VLHDPHVGGGNGLAKFVRDSSRDDAAAREIELHVRHGLPARKLQAPAARLERTSLAVPHGHVAGFRGAEIEPRGGEFSELESAGFVGRGATALADAFRPQAYDGAAERRTVLAANHAPGDTARA
jgi:hypothetical protein